MATGDVYVDASATDPGTLAALDGRTFQVHLKSDGRLLMTTVEVMPPVRPDLRCTVIVGGERCGCAAGHVGKHMWAGGD